MRQVYGGGGGILATDTVENTDGSGNDAFYYNGAGWVGLYCGFSFHGVCDYWGVNPIGGAKGGSEFAIGGTGTNVIVAGLTLDTKYGINYYNVGTSTWYSAGAPNGAVTSLTVTNGGVIVVTDIYGQPWYYMPSNPGWHNFGGAGDQFISTWADIVALTPNHNDIFYWLGSNFGSGGSWNYINNNPSSVIVASPDAAEWGTKAVDSSQLFYNLNADYIVSGCLDVGVTEAYNAPDICLNRSNGSISTYDYGTWVNAGGQAGRVISGAKIYVTGCDEQKLPCVLY
jgi:hypothetical protein